MYHSRHRHWQPCAIYLSNNAVRRIFSLSSFIFSKLSLKLSSKFAAKVLLALPLLLSLPFSWDLYALPRDNNRTDAIMLSSAPFVRFVRANPESNVDNEDEFAPSPLPGVWVDKYERMDNGDEYFRGGFYVQSTDPSSYELNFPSTGLNGLHFYLDIAGVDPSTLNWPPVSHGGITASVAVLPTDPNKLVDFESVWNEIEWAGGVQVTLTGPVATESQGGSDNPGPVAKPTLGEAFEIVGYDDSGNAVIKYGFVLKKWFVYRYSIDNYQLVDEYSSQAAWCDSIGYGMPRIKDLTNAKCNVDPSVDDDWTHWDFKNFGVMFPCRPRLESAKPHSSIYFAQRNIGSFFPEWGYQDSYYGVMSASRSVWTSDFDLSKSGKLKHFSVLVEGGVYHDYFDGKYVYDKHEAFCIYPPSPPPPPL
ncbi:hypothetical protein [Gilliamella sp. Nev5-1]|uniref:hypothetical protein n=1 Tax=Gilliamella sp. Nev5-1 TaxID=3120251 RepID=UPI0015CF6DC9|nr:hypothetical protein [Gilliamella apicola]